MNIQPISNNISMQGGKPPRLPKNSSFIKKCKQAVLDVFSVATFKDDPRAIKKMQDLEAKMSNPAVNRAIMGATALVLQPPIDCFNKSVDEETRKISVCRTLAKIIAGTSVGILVRGSSHQIIKKMTDISAKGKHSRALVPKSSIKAFMKDPVLLNNHRSALSTSLAILAMCFTNFLIDAPLTVYLTNKFKGKSLDRDKEKMEVKHE